MPGRTGSHQARHRQRPPAALFDSDAVLYYFNRLVEAAANVAVFHAAALYRFEYHTFVELRLLDGLQDRWEKPSPTLQAAGRKTAR
jgi:hypothetical protein